uniref:Copper resistance-associated P-type ATPase n=1 Tax=Ganoderma boninense TaxID=34458 RepID=A0A5K1K6F7_9APHY|nr:Copper resistance-associated P-type ATPase [Ganoderma boninense]
MNPHGYAQATYAPVSATSPAPAYDPNSPAGAQFTVNVGVPYNHSAVVYPNGPAAAPSTTNAFPAHPQLSLNPNGPSPIAPSPPVYNANIPTNSIPFPTDPNGNLVITYDLAAIHLNRKANEDKDIDMLSQKSDHTELLRAIQQDIQAQREQNAKDMKNLQDGINGIKEELVGLVKVMKEFMIQSNNTTMRAHGGFQG